MGIRTYAVAATAVLLVGGLCDGTAAAAAAPITYHLTDLGTLGGANSSAYRLNETGMIVGDSNYSPATNDGHAFRYVATDGMTDLGTLGGPRSRATGINAHGETAGWSYRNDANQTIRAFRTTTAGAMLELGSLGGSSGYSYGAAINDSGQVVGWSRETVTAPDYPVLFSNNTVTVLGSQRGNANDINDAGDITGYSFLSPTHYTYTAFVYRDDGSLTRLGTFGGNSSTGTAINNVGQVVGHAQTTGNAATHAFLYTDGEMIDLGTLGRSDSVAMGLNEHGDVVGWTADRGLFEAFVSRDGAMTHLQTLVDQSAAGWTLNHAYDINNFGQITGYGRSPSGKNHAFLLTPIPEPSAAALGSLAAAAAAALLARRRRQGRR